MATKNLHEFKDFQKKNKSKVTLNENVQAVDDLYRVRKRIDIPMSLVNAFKKKVRDESGKNISQFYSDVELAEEIADYVINNHVIIEELPANLILGDQYSKAQGGQGQAQLDELDDTQPAPQLQPQAQGQGQVAQPQAQGQPGAQPVPQGQPRPQGQGQPGPQRTAAQVPPTQAI